MEGIPEVAGNRLTMTSVRSTVRRAGRYLQHDTVKMMFSMTNSRTEAKRATRGGDWCVYGYEHQDNNPPEEALVQ